MADCLQSNDMDLSNVSKPFAFDRYFEDLVKGSKAMNMFPKKRIPLSVGISSSQKRASNRQRATKVSTSEIMSKVSSCFICGQQFDFKDLNEHEKLCLENIKSNDFQYTRQNNEELLSSVSSKAETSSLSNPSVHSASSNEGSDKKCMKCYICGEEIPNYLKGIHEKSCKKNWESGLLQAERRGSVRADIFRSLSRSNSRADVNSEQAGGLRKAKSTTLYRSPSYGNNVFTSNDSLNEGGYMRPKNSRSSTNLNRSTSSVSKSSSNLSKSVTNLSRSVTNLSKKRDSIQENGTNGFATKNRSASVSHSDISKKPNRSTRSSYAAPIRNYSSVQNLKLAIPKANAQNNKFDKAKSLQDLDKASAQSAMRPKSPVDKRKGSASISSPQYVVCHLCGKLYSQHSIMIHIKQCEKTIDKQKSVGTNVEYRIKSRSMADLSKGKTNTTPAGRPLSTTLSAFTSKKQSNGSGDSLKRSTSLSLGINNLALNKTMIDTGEMDEDIPKENMLPGNDKTTLNRTPSSDSTPSPGLQKCYLCGQLYGTRSLPIHQKQCYVKQERLREQESQRKKKKKRDIKVLPFGKSKFPDSPPSYGSSPPKSLESPSKSVMRSQSCVALSRPFSVESFLNGKNSEEKTIKRKGSDEETNGHTDGNRSSSFSSENEMPSPISASSPISFKDMMMTCVHCGCQCEPYTMTIHEKVCRNVASSPDIRIMNCSPESNSMEETITSSGLIRCEGCDGEFYSSEIFQHRINCRTSIL